MKKLTGVLAIFFMAGMLFFGIGERVDGEGPVFRAALAASDKPNPEQCQVLESAGGKINTISQNITEAKDCSPCLWALTESLAMYIKANC